MKHQLKHFFEINDALNTKIMIHKILLIKYINLYLTEDRMFTHTLIYKFNTYSQATQGFF